MQEAIQINYNISISNILPIEAGALNNNYKITSEQGFFFLKEYVHQNDNELSLILEAENYLKEKGVNIVSNIKNIVGNAYTVIDGKKYVLYPFIEGSHPTRENISKEEVFQLGQFLATFHNATKITDSNIPRLPKVDSESVDPVKSKQKIDTLLSDSNINNHPEIAKVVEIKKNILKDYIEKYIVELEADCVIHGDYQDQNIFYVDNNDKKEVFVFDIEKARISSRYMEISRFILLVCFTNGITPESVELAKNFISGYSSIYKLDPVSIEKSFTYWFLKKVSSTWAESEYLKEGKEIMMSFVRNDLKLLVQFEQDDNLLKDTLVKICE